MLQKIRSNIQGTMAKIIIGLICVPFLLWGVDALFMDSGDPDVAEVNGKTISERELSRQIYRQRQQIMARMGDRVDSSQIDESLLREPVLQNLIEQRMLESVAESRHFAVSERMVEDYIVQDPSFQVDGRFSSERFQSLVRSSAINPAEYKAALQKQILVTQLLSGFSFSEFVTPAELTQAVQITGQKRDIEYVLLPLDEARAEVSINEGEAKDYYDAHPEEFKTQEQVVVEYIQLRLEDFYPDLAEAEIRAAYDAEVEKAQASTRRRAAHILLEADAKRSDQQASEELLKLRQRVLAGEEFGVLAEEFSEDVGSKAMGGDLGYSEGDAFPEAFEVALSELEMGQVSEPVETEAGWHLIKLIELESSEPPAYDTRREIIEQQLQIAQAEPRYAVQLEALKDISFNAPDLQSVAGELELELLESSPFNREGAEMGLFADQRLVVEAYSAAVLEDRANSDVVELAADQAVVLRVKRRDLPEPIPFGEAQAAIEESLRESKARESLALRAEKLRDAVRDGAALGTLAEEAGLEHQQFSGLSRDDIGEVEPEVVGAAFQLSPPLAEQAPVIAVRTLEDGDTALIALNKVVPGSVDEIDADKRSNLERLLNRHRSEQVVQEFRTALRNEADIELL